MFRLLLTLDVSKKLGVRRTVTFFRMQCSRFVACIFLFLSSSIIYFKSCIFRFSRWLLFFVMFCLSVSDAVKSVESTHNNAESV